MTEQEFNALAAQSYNRIPVSREVLADLETPLSTFLKLANGPYSYLLESVHGGEKWGRYSIIGLPCRTVLRVSGNQVAIEQDGVVEELHETADPLCRVEEFLRQRRVPDLPNLPRFTGGLVGNFGYDTVRFIEPRLAHCPNPDPLEVPDILLMVSDEVVVFDNLSGKLHIVVHADPSVEGAYHKARRRIDELIARMDQPTPRYVRGPSQQVSETDFVSGLTQEGFENAVERAREYIVEGDVMQVVLSQRLSIPFQAMPLDLYRALRVLNPSPYMYYLDLGDFHVVGSSPEILAHLEEGQVTVRPIAGTRPRGANEQQDLELERDLLADPKELAEHLMLIDLGRNDVGRIAQTGSVELTDRW